MSFQKSKETVCILYYSLVTDDAPTDTHIHVHLPYNFSDTLRQHERARAYAKVSDVILSRGTNEYSMVEPLIFPPPPSFSRSLSFSLDAYYAGPTHRSAIRGDRLLWRTYCSPAAGYCAGAHNGPRTCLGHASMSLIVS